MGSVQIRNRATLAGNLVNASPAADTAPALLVHGAVVVAAGLQGTRRIPLDAFFVRSGVTILEPGELVAAVELPGGPSRIASAHQRRTRRRGPRPRLGDGRLRRGRAGVTRLAFGSLGPRPVLRVDESGTLADPDADAAARDALLEAMLADASPSVDVDARRARVPPRDAPGPRPARARARARAAGERRGRAMSADAVDASSRPDRARRQRAPPRRAGRAARTRSSTRSATTSALTGTKECCLVGECGACTVLARRPERRRVPRPRGGGGRRRRS